LSHEFLKPYLLPRKFSICQAIGLKLKLRFHPEKYCFCVVSVNKADFDKRGTH